MQPQTTTDAVGLMLMSLGLLLSLGFILGHAAERLGLPRVATYVLVGVIFSPSLLGQALPIRLAQWDPLLIDAALGAVAFLIGSELQFSQLRRLRKTILLGTLGQSLGAIVLVAVGLWGYARLLDAPQPLATALILGTIATATAPAATIAIIEQYRTRGPLTTTLLGVVALDDALSIILFTLVLGLIGQGDLTQDMLAAGWEVFGGVTLGGVMGGLLGWFGRHIPQEDLRLPVIIGFIFMTLGLASELHLSTLLSCMSLGLTSRQIFHPAKAGQWLRPMQHIQEVVFLTLFTLAGTHFQPRVFGAALGLVVTYTLMRSAGKTVGAWLATWSVGESSEAHRYLGLALLPQAGVSIGLALIAARTPGLREAGPLIVNVVLGTTIIFEIVAPLLTKFSLTRAGERTQ